MSHAFQPGDVIASKYVLGDKIGEGGFSEVFEATTVDGKTAVALKILRRKHLDSPEAVARFRREGSITSRLSHPHIAHTMDCFGLPDGSRFIVMELLKGQDLASFLQSGGRFTPAVCVELIRQVGDALSAAHNLGFIHRDLKPENVFVAQVPDPASGNLGVFKILDFGATRKMDGVFGLTARGFAIGTPEFMAPELATGDSDTVDHRADQFSLGVLAFQLLTGRLPFEGKNAVNIMLKVANESPPTFAEIGVDLPSGVEAAIRKALSKNPDQRFDDVSAFTAELLRWAPNLSSAPVSAVVAKPSLVRRCVYIGLALACLAITVACFWLLWDSRRP